MKDAILRSLRSQKKKLMRSVRLAFARLFVGEGQAFPPQEPAPHQLPCNFNSEF